MIDFNAPPLSDVIEILMRDMNTGGNILFKGKQLTRKLLPKIKLRALKSADEKFLRTRTIAEVFTPSHVVKFMVDAIDDGQIDSRWLEITCGEAPFITNRYDAESGELIPAERRAGVLDRKLRIAKDFKEAKRAVQSVYGYELQGDSLLIARANVLLTFAEAVKDFSESGLAEIAEIIAWNFFQFDALNVPPAQSNLFEPVPVTEIKDWSDNGRKIPFGGDSMKKFGLVIGNPPYHEETESDSTRKLPVYNKLMEEGYKVGKKVELITPAKFLFNAGYTPKDFNQRMLNDPHLKVLDYSTTADKYFKGVDIKGGVAITLHDETKNFGAIGTYTKFETLNSIQKKVDANNLNFSSLSKIIRGQTTYRLSAKAYEDFPDLSSRVSERSDTALRTNAFEVMPDVFLKDKPDDGHEYLKILGRVGTERVYRFVRREYMEDITELSKWKVFIPASNGSGALGEVVSTPLVGCTQTFITVGAFDTEEEARACLAYIKSKFARAMLGILKVTQHNPPATWAKVPMQDFNPATSDIDWSGNVDAQLYRKYKLDDTEINFIETNVKGM